MLVLHYLSFPRGKFGQRCCLTQTDLYNPEEGHKFFSRVSDPTKTMVNFDIVSPSCLLLEWKNKVEHERLSPTSNILICILTTAQARLKLFDALEKMGRNCVYADTGMYSLIRDI